MRPWPGGSLCAALLLACALCLSACNRGTPSDALTTIRERGRLVVATEAAFEPFEFVANGRIVGYNKDVLDYVAAQLGVPLEQLNLPFQGLLPGLLARKFDFVATSVSITPERARRYAFTRPTGTSANTIVVRADDHRVRSPDDLADLVVATQLASSMQPVVEAHDEQLKARGRGYADLKLFTAFPDTYVALASGQVDAIVIASSSAAVLLKRSPGQYAIAATLGKPSYLAWVTRPEDRALRGFIDSKIDELRTSGKLRELQLKWFGAEMETPADGYLPPGAY
jgi:polar amino acid transport system substrate-binding protein